MISLHVFVTDFVAVISSQSEGLGKMALGIVKIYLRSPFSANRRCSRSVCSRSVGSRSVGSRSVCRGQLSWTQKKADAVYCLGTQLKSVTILYQNHQSLYLLIAISLINFFIQIESSQTYFN